MEVYVNGRWYVGEENCASKKEAEHSAAQKAFADLTKDNQEQPDIGPSDHLPPEYAAVEDFIATMLIPFGGHIRKIKPPDTHGRYRFEIGGNYRYCKNIERHHKKNQVYFLVDPVRKIYFQKCYDPECQGYQSAKQPIYINSTVNNNPPSKPLKY